MCGSVFDMTIGVILLVWIRKLGMFGILLEQCQHLSDHPLGYAMNVSFIFPQYTNDIYTVLQRSNMGAYTLTAFVHLWLL